MSSDLPDLSAYAGRWVALYGTQVTGVGETPDAALHMARHSRPKERFVLRFVDDPSGELLPLAPALSKYTCIHTNNINYNTLTTTHLLTKTLYVLLISKTHNLHVLDT